MFLFGPLERDVIVSYAIPSWRTPGLCEDVILGTAVLISSWAEVATKQTMQLALQFRKLVLSSTKHSISVKKDMNHIFIFGYTHSSPGIIIGYLIFCI